MDFDLKDNFKPAIGKKMEGKEIGQLIREAREKKGLSQTELAELLGVTRATVNGLEADRTSPSVSTLKKVADALGLSLKIIFE